MSIKNIFKKDIYRNIKKVINASEDDSLDVELDEYVITAEIENDLSKLFEAYCESIPNINGVWISGFFGSGKSHLLKMLSLLLENRDVKGKSTLEYFQEKGFDSLLKADIEKATKIRSESILFNIGTESKNEGDASVINAFVKQFYAHLGFCPSDLGIARMEYDLSCDGKLEEFKKIFLALDGQPWEKRRKTKYAVKDKIVKAFAEATGQEEDKSLLTSYSDIKYSASEFAEMVKDYIDSNSKPFPFRLNFFVDEVGQFVAGKSNYLLALQEIASALSDKTKNSSWVFVTCQDKLEDFVETKEDSEISKIQDRFPLRIGLSNENVAEVIQKRLLSKNDVGLGKIEGIYNSYKDTFNMLLRLEGGIKTFVYKDSADCKASYPFRNYDFSLFTKAFVALSEHHAFTGKYVSTQARNLLFAFSSALINVDKEMYSNSDNPLVPFDAFYDGVEELLVGNFTEPIADAKKGLGEDNFAIRVLKTLLFVKYLGKEFYSSSSNISKLLFSSLEDDPNAIKEKTDKALRDLEQECLVQKKNNDEYEFLTNKEKDIEQEIKNINVSDETLNKELYSLLYGEILQTVPKAIDEAGNTFFITKLVDSYTKPTQSYTLSLAIVTNRITVNFADSKWNNTLVVKLENTKDLLVELNLYLQTINYRMQQSGIDEERSKILDSKMEHNKARRERIKESLNSLILDAKMEIRGNSIEETNLDAPTKIKNGLKALVSRVYTNLSSIGNVKYNEELVRNQAFTISLVPELNSVEQQILSRIEFLTKNSQIATTKCLIEYFRDVPFGWPEFAVRYHLITLLKRDKITLKKDGELLGLEESKIEITKNSICNSSVILNIELEKDIDERKIKGVKDFIDAFANVTPTSNTAAALLNVLKKVLTEAKADIVKAKSGKKYPFLSDLEEVEKEIDAAQIQFNTEWVFGSFLDEISENLLQLKEDIMAPCMKFLNTPDMYEKYDNAKSLLENNGGILDDSNKGYWSEIDRILKEPDIYKSKDLAKLPSLCLKLQRFIASQLSKEKSSATIDISNFQEEITNGSDYISLNSEQQNEVLGEFNKLKTEISSAKDCQEVWSKAYKGQIKVKELVKKFKDETAGGDKGQPPYFKVSISSFKCNENFRIIETKEDVEHYVSALSEEMLKNIKEGYKIEK